MIFKVNFAKSLVSRFPNATYVSFCESKFNLKKQQFQDFIFDFLYDRKLLNIAPMLFRCEIQSTYDNPPALIVKCYIKNNSKKTLFCKLEQLAKFQDQHNRYYSPGHKSQKSPAHEALLKRLKATIQSEIDAQIIATMSNPSPNVAARPSPYANAYDYSYRPMDYQSIPSRALVVNHNIENLTLPGDRGEGNNE